MAGWSNPWANVDYERLGRRRSSQSWNGWMSASSAVAREQFLRWAELVQVMLGIQPPARWWPALFGLCSGWFSLWGFPSQWSERYEMGIPTLALVVDTVAGTGGLAEAPTPICVDDLRVDMTDLVLLGGTAAGGTITGSKARFQVAVWDDGNRVGVRYVTPGRPAPPANPAPPAPPQLNPGLYTGLVYAWDRAEYYPLAILFVYVRA